MKISSKLNCPFHVTKNLLQSYRVGFGRRRHLDIGLLPFSVGIMWAWGGTQHCTCKMMQMRNMSVFSSARLVIYCTQTLYLYFDCSLIDKSLLSSTIIEENTNPFIRAACTLGWHCAVLLFKIGKKYDRMVTGHAAIKVYLARWIFHDKTRFDKSAEISCSF